MELECVTDSVSHPWNKVSKAACRTDGAALLLEHHSGLLQLNAGDVFTLVLSNQMPDDVDAFQYAMNGLVAQIRNGVCTISCGGLLVQLPFVESPSLNLQLKNSIVVGVRKRD